ncbi:MAG: cation:proton antiporter [Elainella sp. Prado103]|jgi:NhaP-type Na+/H+ or K+/H+ antiporter|nr:cation:proton antiporter [Elainella sp. Prado103]
MVLTVIAGIGAQVLGAYFKIPSIVFLLLFGILLGADGLNLLHPSLLGEGLEVIVSLSVALILFEGGLTLPLRELNRVSGSLRNLVSFGVLVTLLGGGMAAHWLAEFPWTIAFLYAALVVVTGPTVVSPLLKQVKVDRQVSALLEGEGVLIDPVGAILAVVVLDIILHGTASPMAVVSGLLLRLGIGGGIGAIGGWGLGFLLKRATVLSDELKNLVVLAGVWGMFSLSQIIRSESGLMAMVVAGIVVGAAALPEERLLRRFKGQLTTLAVSVLFVLLAAELSLASILALGWGSLFTVLVLMFVVRPLNIWLCTWHSDMNWQQKLFLCWVAPRGIVSASVASLFAILLTQNGINGGDSIKALVFLTIMLTVFLQGLTAQWVARLLRITSVEATGVVMVGCNALARLIGKLFLQYGESVVLIDTDIAACELAKAENFRVFSSSALDTNVLEEAGLSKAGTFLALTHNAEVNLVVAQRAAEEFNPPRVLAVFSQESPSSTPSGKVQPAFTGQMALKTWNRYLEDGAIHLGETTLRESDLDLQQAHLKALINAGELVPLLIEREEKLLIAPATDEWQVNDRLIYLLHDPRPKLLRQLSGGAQFAKLRIEKQPRVEEIPVAALTLQSATLEATEPTG